MGRLWRTTSSGRRVRTAEGRRHSRVCTLKGDCVFQSREIFNKSFLRWGPPIGKPSILPWGFVSPFDETDIFFPRHPITTDKVSRVLSIAFGGNESKVLPSVVEPIPVNMVYKSPSIFRFANDVIMYEIRFAPSIPIVAFIKSFSFIEFFPNIYVYFSITNQFVFVVVQRGFDISLMNDSFFKYSVSSYRRENNLASMVFTTTVPFIFPSFGFVFVRHNSIVSRIKKFHNRKEVVCG